jgi:hypothetical protein
MALYSVQGPQSQAAAQGGAAGNSVQFGAVGPTSILSEGGLGTVGTIGLLALALIGIAIIFRK